jgi:hypothetical protein
MADNDVQMAHVRLPASLHKQVKQVAEQEGVSLNTFLVAVIARGTAEFALATSSDLSLAATRSDAARGAPSSQRQDLRHAAAVKANASRTPEQRREAALKANASRTPEQRSNAARKAAATRRRRRSA